MHPPEPLPIAGEIGPAATLPDGRLVACYAENRRLENVEAEHPAQPAYARYSSDMGCTWGEPMRIFDFPAGPGVSGLLETLVDRTGRVHTFSLRFFSVDVGKLYHSILLHSASDDAGHTWSPLKEIDFGARFTGSLNGAMQMDGGRILVPLSYWDDAQVNGKFVSRTVYSDDGGQTWGQSNGVHVASGGDFDEAGAVEPVCVQLGNGLVWMVIRTVTGYFWESFSNEGAIWTPAITTRIVASNAPAGLLRLADGQIVLVWNNLYGEPFGAPGISYARQALHAAVSADDGQTWSRPIVVAGRRPDEPLKTQTTYPFLCQAPDGAIVLVYHRVYAQPGRDWSAPIRELVRVDPTWLAS